MAAKIESQITFLPTRDLNKTAQFYEQIMGLPLALDQKTCRIYKVSDNAFIGFFQRDQVEVNNDLIISFVTFDVDRLCAQLEALGVRIDKEPTYNPEYQVYHCFVRDPNGYQLEIQRFEDPRWRN